MPRGGRKLKGASTSRTSKRAVHASAHLGASVRKMRLAAGLTQEALAAKADIDTRYLQDIEQGATNPTLAMLVALAAALGVPVAELLQGL